MLTNQLHFDTSAAAAQRTELLSRLKAEIESGQVGYYTLPDTQGRLLEKIKVYGDSPWIKEQLRCIVVIGIGGSSLGTKAAYEMIGAQIGAKEILFLENVDPIEIEHTLQRVMLERTLFLMISKSGTTIETTSIAKYVMQRFGVLEDAALLQRHFVVITDDGSPLDKFASANGIEAFSIPQNVGGRFSVLSAVGLLPLYLAGFDITALLEGAKSVRDQLLDGSRTDLLDKALYYYGHREKNAINVLFGYGTIFEAFNRWYVQLWGESLGKIDAQNRHVGLTPIGLTGAVDQHSFLQLIMEGPADKTVTFVRTEHFGSDLSIPDISLPFLEKTDYANGYRFEELINGECDATLQSVVDQGIPADLLNIDILDAWHAGALFIYFELLTSLVGILEGVNTYDQPGVEKGKTILRETLGNNHE